MYSKLIARTALITTALCLLFGAYQIWVMATGDFEGGRFGLLASQRHMVYVAGLALPLAAFVATLFTERDDLPSGAPALVLGLCVGSAVLLLTMGLAPVFETIMMRAALWGVGATSSDGTVSPTPVFTAQGWWHWWGVYASGNARVAEMLGLNVSESKPFWRTAGLLAWQPMYAGAAAVLTTLLGVELAGRGYARAHVDRWRAFAAFIVVQATIVAGWKCSRILAIRFDVPPEGALALVLVGPALLMCGALLRGATREPHTVRDA